ncbi:MAG: ABC transporter permease [Gammaproteobacteria bacterium]|nr:MAG: ABC transporter permease [Gammaproteobacteria bacterium]
MMTSKPLNAQEITAGSTSKALTQHRRAHPSHWFRVLISESRFEILKTMRQPGFVIPSLAFPMMFYLFFGIIFNRNGMGSQMPVYMMATYGTFGVIGPSLFSFGVGVAVEKSQGWFDLKQASPIPPLLYIIARIVLAMAFSLAILIGLYSIGALLGDVVLHRTQWLLLTLTLLLGAIPFCLFGLFIGLRFKAQSAPAIVNLIYLPSAFFSGLWIPIMLFPDYLQKLANLLPPYHLAQLVLHIISGDDSARAAFTNGQSVSYHLILLAGYTLLFGWMAIRSYQKEMVINPATKNI